MNISNITHPKITVTVQVIKQTDNAILVLLLDYHNREAWFPKYYVSNLGANREGDDTIEIPQYILLRKLESIVAKERIKASTDIANATNASPRVTPWKKYLVEACSAENFHKFRQQAE